MPHFFCGHIVQEISEPTRIKKENVDQEDFGKRKDFQKQKDLGDIVQNQKANGNQYAITYFHCLIPLFARVPYRLLLWKLVTGYRILGSCALEYGRDQF
jgi:hypothetical protein